MVDKRLEDVLEDCIATRHVPVQRGVTDRHLGLVAGGNHHLTVLVGNGHQQGTANSGLEILLGHAELGAGEDIRQSALVLREQVGDRDLIETDAEAFGQIGRVAHRAARTELRRHRHPPHCAMAEGVDGDGRGESRIDTSRKPDHHLRETVLADVVAKPQGDCSVDLLQRLQGGGRRRVCELVGLGERLGADSCRAGAAHGLADLDIHQEQGLLE